MPLPSAEGKKTYCGDCLKNPPNFDHVIAVFYYANPVKKIIKTFKFGYGFYCAPFLREALIKQLIPDYADDAWPQVLIPVPLHQKRLRERGFNQALELTRKIAKKLAIPMDITSCIREKNNLPQTRLDAKSRRKQKLSWKIADEFNYKHVAIIDDVMTTGTTVNSLAKALRKKGVERIDIWVCARTVPLSNTIC
jgi:ComF family protein